MNNVTINGNQSVSASDKSVKLNNGSLLLHYNKLGEVLGAYLITSFRDNKGKYGADYTGNYCSFINLDTGYICFEERCSRTTTVARVLSHLNNGDFQGERAIKEGQYIEVYVMGKFKIDVQFNREERM